MGSSIRTHARWTASVVAHTDMRKQIQYNTLQCHCCWSTRKKLSTCTAWALHSRHTLRGATGMQPANPQPPIRAL